MDDRKQQLAVLLNVMGKDNALTALEGFDEGVASELNSVLQEFENDPPSLNEIETVLNDFERFFNFAFKQIKKQEVQQQIVEEEPEEEGKDENESEEEGYDAQFETQTVFSVPELTGDVKHDLNLLHPYQVAKAIRDDHPNSIATVINVLTDDHAGQTMENLPPDVRLDVFLKMAEPQGVPQEIQDQILKATLDSALKVTKRVAEINHKEQMVALVRSLPKNVRTPLIDKLKEENQELAEELKSEMFQFDDILKLEDREIQKVLGQSSTDALVLALVKAEESLKERLLGNMSKRARQTILDELEFKTNATEDEVAEGEKEIVGVLMKMDEEGEISLG